MVFERKHTLLNLLNKRTIQLIMNRKTAKSYKKIWIPNWVATEHAVVRDIKIPAWKQVSRSSLNRCMRASQYVSSFDVSGNDLALS